MQKKFLTNLGLLLFLNFLVKPFWLLGIDRTVQNVVGPESYGFYFTILNFSFLFNILLDFGIYQFNNRNIAQNRQLLNKHFSSIILLRVLLALVYLFVIFTVAIIWGYDAGQLKLLAIIGFNQFLLSFVLYLRSNITGLMLFKTDSLLSVLDRLLMILFCSLLLWGNVTDRPFQIEWFVYAQTLAYLSTVIVALAVVIKKASFKRFNWNWPFFVMIIKQSYPYALLVLLMSFYNRVDSVLIERLLPKSEGNFQAGIYAQSFRLLDAVNMVGYLFSVQLLPLFSRMLKKKESVGDLVRLSITLLMILGGIIVAGSYFFRTELISLLYGIHSSETLVQYADRIAISVPVFAVLMAGFVPIVTTYVFGTLLTANANLRDLNRVAAAGVVLNLSLNVLLIPHYKALGAALAGVSAQLITAGLQVWLVQRVFRFKVNKPLLLRLGVYFLGLVAINFFCRQLAIDWLLQFVLMVAGSVSFAAVLGLLNVRSILMLFLKKQETEEVIE